MRCEGDKNDLRVFDCFGPKVLAGINAEKKSGTVADRSIVLRLERRPAEAKRLTRLYEVKSKAPAKIPTLTRKLARLAEKHAEEMKRASPDMPESLNDRACEIWAPLIALADLESKEEGKRLRDVALTVSEHAPKTEDWGLELLGDIKDLLTQIAESPSGTGMEVVLDGAAVRVQITTDRGRDFIGARNLQQGLTANLELRWPTFDHGKPITIHKVTSKLKSYGVVTVKIKALGNCAAYALDGDKGLRKAIETYGPDAEK